MGVRGLHTIISQDFPQVKEQIDIAEHADRFMKSRYGHDYRSQGRRPVLAIDGKALHRYIYGKLDTICGGQWVEYCEQVKYFCSKFQMRGIRLIFVFDGGCVPSKRKEWARRRRDNLRECQETFRGLRCKPQRLPPRRRMPVGMTIATRYVLENMCDSPVVASLEECDKDLSHFAKDMDDCFAILSNDTDFLIYKTKYYLTCDELNVETLTTIGYNRETLLKCLNLRDYELPILSCLMGNDVINYKWLKPFHDKLIWLSSINQSKKIPSSRGSTKGRFDRFEYSFGDLIREVASFIKEHNIGSKGIEMDECRRISELVFSHPGNTNLVHEALRMYDIRGKSRLLMFYLNQLPINELPFQSKTDCPFDLLHYSYHRDPHIFQILSQLEYEFGPALEDPFDNTIAHSSIIFKLMRQRVYYLLLRGLKLTKRSFTDEGHYTEEMFVHEWIAMPGNTLYEAEPVPPLSFHIPSQVTIRDLWFDKSIQVQSLKYNVFYELLNLNSYVEQSFFAEFPSLPAHLWLFVILLKYLKRGEVASLSTIQSWELKAIIAQAVCLMHLSAIDLHLMAIPEYIDPRAIHLSTLIRVGIRYLSLGLGAVGLADTEHIHMTMPWNWIDGKLFQAKYKLAKEGASAEMLVDNQHVALELFTRILNLVESPQAPTNQSQNPSLVDIFTHPPRRQLSEITSSSNESNVQKDLIDAAIKTSCSTNDSCPVAVLVDI